MYSAGFILLILFCALKPFALLDLNLSVAGFNWPELYSIIFSYLLIFFLALKAKNIKYDLIAVAIILFCIYCIFSFFWGSSVRMVSRVVLPFVVFIYVRTIVNDEKQLNLLLIILIVSFVLPIVGSLYKIYSGTSIIQSGHATGIPRHHGLYKTIHLMSYAMFFFSVLFYMKIFFFPETRKVLNIAYIGLAIGAVYCLYKTYARTAYIGLFLFILFSLLGYSKRIFVLFIAFVLMFVALNYASVEELFTRTKDADIETASSGRTRIWEHNIQLFLKSSFENKMLGEGLGVKTKAVFGQEDEIWSSHNDYLHLLMQGGLIGLVLYLVIHLILIKDIIFAKISYKKKYFFGGVFCAIIFMNFVSGIILYNIGVSQIFWLIMASLYNFKHNYVINDNS